MTDEETEATDEPPRDEARDKPKSKPRKRLPRRPEQAGGRAAPKGKRGASAAPSSAAGLAGMSGTALLVALVALVIGVGIGWLARGTGVGAETVSPSASVSSSASAAGGPCDLWAEALCQEIGDPSDACQNARSAADLLPDGACQAARSEVPATLAKIKSARSTCDELVRKLCADLGEASDSCKIVKEKTPSFPTGQCDEMLGSYDEVVAELRQMENQNAPLTPELAAAQRAGNGPSFGPADAKVTVVEYSDFQCPFCARAAAVVQKLKKNYSDRVRFVFRQFPLPMHDSAALASEAALAAHEQGKFWEMHDKMFENQQALDRKSLEGYAQGLGLDMVRFNKALDGGTQRSAVEADKALGDKIGVNGTPTMIVNDKRVPDPSDYEALAALIDSELAAAQN